MLDIPINIFCLCKDNDITTMKVVEQINEKWRARFSCPRCGNQVVMQVCGMVTDLDVTGHKKESN